MASALDQQVPAWVRGKGGLEQAWIDTWIEHGSVTLADEAVRTHSEYDTYFAGNKRDDGTVRLTEDQYLSTIEGYQQTLLSVALNPDIFQERFGDLIAGDVDIGEFTDRVEQVRTQILDQAPEIAAFYQEAHGLEMTPEAVYASFLDPTVGEAILSRKIAVSQVGGTAATKGFAVSVDFVESLLNEGLDIYRARQVFGEAESMIPTLSILAARHADPDDDFDLNEFTQATVFNDPTQRQRIRRLQAQERSTFREGVGQGQLLARNQAGLNVGLVRR